MSEAVETIGLTPDQILKKYGFSSATLYRLLKSDPTFPRGRWVTKRRRLWDAAEVDQWWQSLPRS